MKTKNLILGLVALTFAIGSAFTSSKMVSNMYVKAYTSQANFQEGIISCVNTGQTCEDVTSVPNVRCGVTIPLQSSTTVVTDKTYKNSNCTTQVKETSSHAPLSGITPVYALAE
jgi:hypothetical protein